jgi:hypothetical protein
MRFCHAFTLTANSRDGKQARVPRKCVGAKAGVRCDQPQLIGFFPRAIFLQQIARPSRYPKNLTEFPFAHNFSKPDLEVL